MEKLKKNPDLFKNCKIKMCQSWFSQIPHILFIRKYIHPIEIMSTHGRALAQIQKI